ncbi:MAG TPA: hypothetical protein VM010_08155, partial [Chitinophagaceae bacterium]|nr:hypothetical protein [Chitinophagaceae bacterium]
DTALNNKTVLLVGTYLPQYTNFFETPSDTLYIQKVDSFKAFNRLSLRWLQPIKQFRVGEKPVVILELSNAGTDTIQANDVRINYTFLKTRSDQYTPPGMLLVNEKKLPPGFKKTYQLPLQLAPTASAYRLLFSLVQPPLAGNFASPFYKLVIK